MAAYGTPGGAWASKLALVVALAVGVSAAPAAAEPAQPDSGDIVPGAYIVTLRGGERSTDVVAAARRRGHDADITAHYDAALNGFAARMPDAAARHLAADPRVLRVEPDRYVSVAATQTSAPWGLDRVDQRRLPLSTTYDYNTAGAGVKVYVIDTGVRATHVELAGRVAPGYDAVAGTSTDDCEGHGTHVAATAAGTTYGVAKAATVVPVRVLDCDGSGFVSDVIEGVDWVTAQHATGTPGVANLSLGADGFSTGLDASVRASVADGVVHVVAAGNENVDACTVAPASTAQALTVGATTSSDARWLYRDQGHTYGSNYGTCLDLFAPGHAITSAIQTSDTATGTWSGTSMATPHVAGAAARYLQIHPTATPAEVHDVLVDSASTGVSSAGTGSPDALLYAAPPDTTPPTLVDFSLSPTSVDVTSSGQAVVARMRITDDLAGARAPTVTMTSTTSGDAVTDVAERVSGTVNDGVYEAELALAHRAQPGTWSATVSPLVDLQANTATEEGPEDGVATTVTVVRHDPPGQPTSVTAVAGDSAATVGWLPPSSDGGSPITSYRISSSGGHIVDVAGTASSGTVTGLTNGTSYTFTVTARNAAGAGPASDPSGDVTPQLPPDTAPPQLVEFTLSPVSVDVTSDSADVTVSMRITDDVTGVDPPAVTLTNPSTGSTTGPVSSQRVSGTITDGRYEATLSVAERGDPGTWEATVSPLEDIAGNTTASPGPGDEFDNAVTVVRHDPPGQPQDVAATAGDGRADVTWSPPLNDGGSPVTAYRVTSSDGHVVDVGGSTTSATVTGLANGTTYSFAVRASNAGGTGAVSDPSNTVTPKSADTARPTVRLTAPTRRVTLRSRLVTSWTADDVGTGVRSSDVRWRRAKADGRFSGWVYPSGWQGTTSRKVAVKAPPGFTYCFSIRARDRAGNTSAWSRQRCTTRPLDDRALHRSSAWTAESGRRYYAKTYVATQVRRSTVRTGVVRTRHVALVATTCPRCGVVTVSLAGTVLKRISLKRATLRRRSVIPVATFARARRGRIVVRVVAPRRRLEVDGIAVAR